MGPTTDWRKAEESNPRPEGRSGFQGRLPARPAVPSSWRQVQESNLRNTQWLYELAIRCLTSSANLPLVGAAGIAPACSQEGWVTATWAHYAAQHARRYFWYAAQDSNLDLPG